MAVMIIQLVRLLAILSQLGILTGESELVLNYSILSHYSH